MRSVRLQIATAVSSVALALAMQAANHGFEAAGSVPDIESCGFLAGSLGALAMVYPTLAALVAGRAVRALGRVLMPGIQEAASIGSVVGLAGACLYFGFGVLLMALRGADAVLTPSLGILLGLDCLLCAAAGALGAAAAAARLQPGWRDASGQP